MRILKVIALLLEYPDDALWDNREEALALVSADAPALTPFVRRLLAAPLLDRRPNGVRYLNAVAPPRCCCLNTFTPNHAIAAGRWSI